jgi:hypothetical protein
MSESALDYTRCFSFSFISYSTFSSSFFKFYQLVSIRPIHQFPWVTGEFMRTNSQKYHKPLRKYQYTAYNMLRKLCDWSKCACVCACKCVCVKKKNLKGRKWKRPGNKVVDEWIRMAWWEIFNKGQHIANKWPSHMTRRQWVLYLSKFHIIIPLS